MEWKDWMGKTIFVKIKDGSVYTGKVVDVYHDDNSPLYWIVLIDKFGDRVQLVHSEIIKIVEEKK